MVFNATFNNISDISWRSIRYFLVFSIPAETPAFSFIGHVIWRKLQASLLPVWVATPDRYYLLKNCDWNNDIIASNCTKKTTEMLYLLPTLPSIRFTLRNTAPVLRKLNGHFHFYRDFIYQQYYSYLFCCFVEIKKYPFLIRYFLVFSIPAETPVFSFIGHVIWRKLQASLLPVWVATLYYLLKKCEWNNAIIASNCTKKTTEMLYLLPTLPSIRFTLRNTAPVLRKLNGPFHFYREWHSCLPSFCNSLFESLCWIRYFLVISIPAETPVFSFIDHVIWRKLQASLLPVWLERITKRRKARI
jgi:hypothetical protein